MRVALWMCTLVALPAVTRAQESAVDSVHTGGGVFGAWAGASLSSVAVFGTITDRRLVLTGLRYERAVENGSVTTTYTFDLHPLAVVTNTPRYGMERLRAPNGVVFSQLVETGRSPVVGAGISPLGLQIYSAPRGNTRLFGGGSAGGIWFNRDMPMVGARRFNFALQLGGGLEVTSRNGGALVLGYKFHHLSNAGTARVNPGMDDHVLYVGVMRRRAERVTVLAKGAGEGRSAPGPDAQRD